MATKRSQKDGETALDRLKSISDLVVELTKNLDHFPNNRSTISQLEQERKELIKRYVRQAPPYP